VTDSRVVNFAKILVEHSARIVPGDRVLIEATTAAEPLIRELYIQILEKGGIPHPMVALPGMMPFSQDELYLTYAKDAQLDFIPHFIRSPTTSSRAASASIRRRTRAAPPTSIP
jgi:aminopeptidase